MADNKIFLEHFRKNEQILLKTQDILKEIKNEISDLHPLVNEALNKESSSKNDTKEITLSKKTTDLLINNSNVNFRQINNSLSKLSFTVIDVIKEIANNSKIISAAVLASTDKKNLLSNVRSLVNMTTDSFVNRLSAVIKSNKEKVKDKKSKIISTPLSVKGIENKNTKNEPKGLSSNIFQSIEKEISKLSSLTNKDDISNFLKTSKILSSLFLEFSKWSDSTQKQSPLEGAVKSFNMIENLFNNDRINKFSDSIENANKTFDRLKDIEIGYFIKDFLNKLTKDKELLGFFNKEQKDKPDLDSLFDSNTGIPMIFRGVKTLLESLQNLPAIGLKTMIQLKILKTLNFESYITKILSAFKNIKIDKDLGIAFSQFKEFFGLFDTIKNLSIKSIFDIKRTLMIFKVVQPHKFLKNFLTLIAKNFGKEDVEKMKEMSGFYQQGTKLISDMLSPSKTLLKDLIKSKIVYKALHKANISKDFSNVFSQFRDSFEELFRSSKLKFLLGNEYKKGENFKNLSLLFQNISDTTIGRNGYINIFSEIIKKTNAFLPSAILFSSTSFLISKMFVSAKNQIMKILDFKINKEDIEKMEKNTTVFLDFFQRLAVKIQALKKSVTFDVKTLLNLSKILKEIVQSSKIFSKNEKILMAFPKVFSKLMSSLITEFKKLEQLKLDNKEKTIYGVAPLAKSIKLLSTSILLLALVVPLVGIANLGLALVSKLIISFAKISKYSKQIASSAKALTYMSLSLLAFSGSLVLSSIILSKLQAGAMIKGLFFLGLIVGIFYMISQIKKFSENILKTSIAITLLSLSLIAFSFAIKFLSQVAEDLTLEKTGMIFLLLGGFFGLMMLIGLPKVSLMIGLGLLVFAGLSLTLLLFAYSLKKLFEVEMPNEEKREGILSTFMMLGKIFIGFGVLAPLIAIGSVAMLIAGPALLLMSVALKQLNDVKFPDEKKRGEIKESFIMVGKIFSMLSIFSPFIITGAAAMMMAGHALTSISKGLESSMKVNWAKIPIDSMIEVITGLGKAFASISMAGGFLGALQSINPLSMLGVTQTPVERGIKSVLKASEALESLGRGLKNFDKWSKELNISDPTKDENSLINRITRTISGVGSAFSEIGGKGSGFSLMKLAFGADVGSFAPTDTEKGIKSVMKSGEALDALGQGLRNFDKWSKELNLSDPKKDENSLINRITRTISAVNTAFSEIGRGGKSSFSLLKFAFGADVSTFAPSDTEKGINSVMKTGDALKSVATGLLEFGELSKTINLDPKDPQSITKKMVDVLTVIKQIFSDIGKVDQTDKTFGLLNIIGLDFSKSNTERGIESVKNVGSVFSGIANGLKIWSDLDKEGINIDNIKNNIAKILTLISVEFSKIGQQGDNNWFSTNDVKTGIESVEGVGKIFKDIADSIKIWNDLSKNGMDSTSFDIEKRGSIAWNIKSVLTLISKVFSDIGSNSLEMKDENGRTKFLVQHKAVQKGIEAVRGVGSELKNIAQSIKIFSDMAGDPKKVQETKNAIKEFINTVSNVFSEIGQEKKNEKYIQKGIENVRGLGDELKKISESIKVFSDGSKKSNIKEVSKDLELFIREFVSLISGLGGNQSNWSYRMPGVDMPQANELDNGASILSRVINKAKDLNKINDIKLNQRGIMKDFVAEIKDLFSIVTFAEDKDFTVLDNIASFFDRIANAASSFNSFKTSFSEYNQDFKKYIDNVNRLDLKNLNSINAFSKITFDIGNSKENEFKVRIESLENILKNLIDQTKMSHSIVDKNLTKNENLNQEQNDIANVLKNLNKNLNELGVYFKKSQELKSKEADFSRLEKYLKAIAENTYQNSKF